MFYGKVCRSALEYLRSVDCKRGKSLIEPIDCHKLTRNLLLGQVPVKSRFWSQT